MAFLGHLFPIYLRFKGGKGVATGLGVSLALNWVAALIAVGVWVLVLLPFRIVALSSIVAGVALPVSHALVSKDPFGPDFVPISIFFILGGTFVLVRHFPNVKRIARGEEPRVFAARPK